MFLVKHCVATKGSGRMSMEDDVYLTIMLTSGVEVLVSVGL